MPFVSNTAQLTTHNTGLWKDPWFDPSYTHHNDPAVNPLITSADANITPDRAKLQLFKEKLRHNFQGGQLRFLPMSDGVTEETPEMRAEYIKMFLKEPSIKAALLSKIIAVASMKWSIIPASEDPKDKRVAEWVDHCIRSCKGGLRKICENILLFGLVNGQSLNEKLYSYQRSRKFSDLFPDGYVTNIHRIKVKEGLDYRLEVDQFRNVKGIWSHQAARRFDPSLFVLFNFMPMYENPAGTSDLRAAIRAYNIINMAHQFRAIYLEQFSLPVMKGTIKDPNDKEMLAFLEAAIQDVRSLGWFVVPEGTAIEALNIAARGESEFNTTIEDLRKEIYLCLVGSYLQAMEGDTPGGAGSSSVHKSTQELFIWYLAELVSEVINDQIIDELVKINLSDVDSPRIQIAAVEDTELLVAAQILTTLQGAGLDMSKKEAYRRFQVTPPADENDALKPAQSQQPGMPGMGGGPDAGGEDLLSGLKNNLMPKPKVEMSEGEPPATAPQQYKGGAEALWNALVRLNAAKLNVVSLANEMGIGDDGTIDYGTLFRVGRYHGLNAKMIDGSNEDAGMRNSRGASVFELNANTDDDSVAITAMSLPGQEPGVYVVVEEVDVVANRLSVIMPDGDSVSMPLEDFLADWPVTRKVLVLSVEQPDDDDEETVPVPNSPVHQMSDTPDSKKKIDDDEKLAPAGPDGKDLNRLLNKAIAMGARDLESIAAPAVKRLMAGEDAGDGLLNEDELQKFSDSLLKACAPADLLGRAAIRLRQQKAKTVKDDEAIEKFSETPIGIGSSVAKFAEGKAIMPMNLGKSLDYFRSLIPKMNVQPTLWGKTLKRKVFTMAEATNKTMLVKAQKAITKAMKEGKNGTQAVQDVLDDFGVTPKNPQYAELCYRTNCMEAMNQAAMEEYHSPDMQEDFPVWRYDGIKDGRQGADHEPHFSQYYPSKVSFAEVRGPRVFNCRCVLPGQYVSGEVLLASKSRYSGQVVDVVTRSGQRISLTINHPVLTVNGFVSAGSLNKGMNLVGYKRSVDHAFSGDDQQNKPTVIEQIFSSLCKSSNPSGAEALSVLDFHGDGVFIKGDVEIVTSDVPLRFGFDSFFFESANQFGLASGNVAKSSLTDNRTSNSSFTSGTDDHSCPNQLDTQRLPSDTKTLGDSRHPFATHVTINERSDIADLTQELDAVSVAVASEGNPSLCEPSHDPSLVASVLFGDFSEKCPRTVVIDDVVDVSFRHYDGPVYDLQTKQGVFAIKAVYQSDISLVVSNCMFTPIYVEEWKRLKKRGKKIGKFSESFGEWEESKHKRDDGGKFTTSSYDGKTQHLLHVGGKEVGEISTVKRDDGHHEVSNVLVWPDHQRQGHGTNLYAHAQRQAAKEGKKLYISQDRTDDAKALHAKMQAKGMLKDDGEVVKRENRLSKEGKDELIGVYRAAGGKKMDVWLKLKGDGEAVVSLLRRRHGEGTGTILDILPDVIADLKEHGITKVSSGMVADDERTGTKARDRLFAALATEAKKHGIDVAPAKFSEYHGPNPPGGQSYWVLKGTGPRGGKIWQRKKTAEMLKQPVEKAISKLEFKVDESKDAKWKSPEHIDEHREQFVDAYEKGQAAFERVAIEVKKLREERDKTVDEIKKADTTAKLETLFKALADNDRHLDEFQDHASKTQRDVFLHTFGVSPKNRHEFEIDSDNDHPDILAMVTRSAEFVEQIMHKSSMKQEIVAKDTYLNKVHYQGPPKIDFEYEGKSGYGRLSAFARKTNTGATIAVQRGDEDRVMVHEIGHFVEYYLTDEAKTKISKFREDRFGKDKAEYRQLRKMFPKHGFDASEVTMFSNELHNKGAFNYENYQRHNPEGKDEYGAINAAARVDQQEEIAKKKAAYVGKIYGGGATEIISMGLELLHSAPAHFAKADPEYFNMMIDVLQGGKKEKSKKEKKDDKEEIKKIHPKTEFSGALRTAGFTGHAILAHDQAIQYLDKLPKDREHGVLLDANTGDVLSSASGKPPTKDGWVNGEVAAVDIGHYQHLDKDVISIHTHMDEVSSFSDGDWGMHALSNEKAMSVIDKKYVYTVVKSRQDRERDATKERSRYNPRDLREKWNKILADVEAEDFKASGQKYANAEAWIHEVNIRMASELGYTYSRRDKKTGKEV